MVELILRGGQATPRLFAKADLKGEGTKSQQDTLQTNDFHNFLESYTCPSGFPFILRNENHGSEETEAQKGVRETFIYPFNWIGLINSMSHPLND